MKFIKGWWEVQGGLGFIWFVLSVGCPPASFPLLFVWQTLAVAIGAANCIPDEEPDYQLGSRGGRYTLGRSWDGGEYKRYR